MPMVCNNVSYTRKLAKYAAELTPEQISLEDRKLAKQFILDALGCMVAGSSDDNTRKVRDLCGTYSGVPTSHTIGQNSVVLDARCAALLNGIAAHVRDFDDHGEVANGNISSVVLSTLLAIGEKAKCTGLDILTAYVVGLKVSSTLGGALTRGGYDPFWDPNGTVLIFGAVCAAGRLLHLTEQEITDACAIASVMASGVKANNGSFGKDLIAGHAAANAVFAVELATAGLPFNDNVIEGPKGMAALTAPSFDPKSANRIFETDDRIFFHCEMGFKMYPTCRGVQNAIDAAITIREKYHLAAADIASILCEAEKTALQNERPATTPKMGKNSLAYCIALGLLNGQVKMEDFRRSEIPEEIHQLIPKVQIVQAEFPSQPAFTTKVTVTCLDGRTVSEIVEYPKGDCHNLPMDLECVRKFRLCADILGERRQEETIRFILDLEEQADLVPLFEQLCL